MSEGAAFDVTQPGALPAGTAGAVLRAAREAAGLHIAALAVALKVPVRKLEALEADDLGQLPDAVFARALAASVCRSLKIDAAPVLALLPQLEAPPLQVGVQGRPVRLETHRSMRLPDAFRLPRPVVVTVGVLLLAALFVLALPTLRDVLPGGDAPDTEVAPVPAAAAPVAETIVATPPAPAVPAAKASELLPAAPAEAAPALIASLPAVATSAPVPAQAADGAAVAVFSAHAASWVQVSGSDGVVHLRKTMNPGEVARVGGALPLSVVIGRADAVQVQVRGKAFELAPLARDNVARFQIR